MRKNRKGVVPQVRVPTAKPTKWHKDKSKHDRKKVKLKIKKGEYDNV